MIRTGVNSPQTNEEGRFARRRTDLINQATCHTLNIVFVNRVFHKHLSSNLYTTGRAKPHPCGSISKTCSVTISYSDQTLISITWTAKQKQKTDRIDLTQSQRSYASRSPPTSLVEGYRRPWTWTIPDEHPELEQAWANYPSIATIRNAMLFFVDNSFVDYWVKKKTQLVEIVPLGQTECLARRWTRELARVRFPEVKNSQWDRSRSI